VRLRGIPTCPACARHRVSDPHPKPDGSWTEDEITGTGFPKVFYLKYDMYRNAWPLLALATFRKLVEQAGESVNGAVRTLAGPLPDTASGGAG
jgi:hypothetical protein